MKSEPIPVQPQRPAQKSGGGIKLAGAVAAGVLALGVGAGVLAAVHTAEAGPLSATAAAAEPEQSFPASDLFGVTKPTAEPTEAPTRASGAASHPSTVSTAPQTSSTSHEKDHETEHQPQPTPTAGGDD